MTYQEVMERVADAARRKGRDPAAVTLIAVSKTKTPDEILQLYNQGHRDFGENRAQEMAAKAAHLPRDIRWHFVGSLQSNKARIVRPIAHLLHSMDRLTLARSWMKGPGSAPPALLQVNVAAEPSKSGVSMEGAGTLLSQMIALGVDVRGLMAIPPPPASPEDSRPHFEALRRLQERLNNRYPGVVELSMGMTDDFEIAIEEGASLIRVGRAIFGDRN